jgi:Na+-translocating ferredoxin:NAD+ oxidoreductase RnfC subunit
MPEPEKRLVPLVVTLVGCSMCAAACFVMLIPYQVYRLARVGFWRLRRQGKPHPDGTVLVEKRSFS